MTNTCLLKERKREIYLLSFLFVRPLHFINHSFLFKRIWSTIREIVYYVLHYVDHFFLKIVQLGLMKNDIEKN
jgi:hypothetical protein